MLTPKASAIFLTVSILGSGVAPDSIFVIVCKVMPASFDNLSWDIPNLARYFFFTIIILPPLLPFAIILLSLFYYLSI